MGLGREWEQESHSRTPLSCSNCRMADRDAARLQQLKIVSSPTLHLRGRTRFLVTKPDPHLKQCIATVYCGIAVLCGNPYINSCWDRRPFGHNRHAPKSERGCSAPFRGGAADILICLWTKVRILWHTSRNQDESLLSTTVCKMTPLYKWRQVFKKTLKSTPVPLLAGNSFTIFLTPHSFSSLKFPITILPRDAAMLARSWES